MLKIKKLLVASLAAASLVFSASICASAAQIDSLSIVDNTIYAQVTAENARLYAVEYSEGLLSDVFFTDIVSTDSVELEVGEASEYALYLWDKDSLAPASVAYTLKNGVAYPEGSETPIPEYLSYSFNQDDSVMVVSSIDNAEIKGFKAGVETTYALTNKVVVSGLSDSIADVVPGSVVLIGTNNTGKCAAIELLASIGWPIDEAAFKEDYGVYSPSDGSTKYENIVNVMFSKSGSKLKLENVNGKAYFFESSNIKCYRVGLALMGDTPIVSVSEHELTDAFKDTSKFSNYVYLRVDTEQSKTSDKVLYKGLITQCVIYSVPKELNFNPEGEGEDRYSPIFGLEPIVIID